MEFSRGNFKFMKIQINSLSPLIEYNNIVNCKNFAIAVSLSSNILVKYNYIKDCFGKVGVDTNEGQCWNVVYSNYYRTTPVPDAGCGW